MWTFQHPEVLYVMMLEKVDRLVLDLRVRVVTLTNSYGSAEDARDVHSGGTRSKCIV